MSLTTRPISWLKPALKEFQSFPAAAQTSMLAALTVAAAGSKADIAKPLLGFGPGGMQIALRHRGDAFRVVYALQLGPDLIVVHAFQKKSPKGVATAARDVAIIKQRLKAARDDYESRQGQRKD